MKIVDVPSLKFSERLYDKLMIPVMFILRGLKTDSLQETHPWHTYRVDSKKIDLSQAIKSRGYDKSRFSPQGKVKFLFHAPILGGWRDFSVYEVNEADTPFHIGWISFGSSDDELLGSYINLLPIRNNQIRMLDGTSYSYEYYFAVNTEGVQVPLRKVGSGKINDGSFKNIRLF